MQLKLSDVFVRRYSTDALANLGESASKAEVINGLLIVLGDKDDVVRRRGAKGLGRMIASAGMTGAPHFSADAVLKLVENKWRLIESSCSKSTDLFNIVWETKVDSWLPLTYFVALCEGSAVTIAMQSLKHYRNYTVKEFNVASPENDKLLRRITEAFVEEGEKIGFFQEKDAEKQNNKVNTTAEEAIVNID
ncbi:unnamed protein product [Didymodactylos carnosus]|uniref:Uncharacterized protein n=1 Tax=Didymodactylos carnosus TaxID=1234261 RepID=A0A814XKJ5_9BILA|nr:unnamed protein product [Didymodactylos carnosus]CAF1216611.1 unnamed protein product [Didymodactylos carnosus]CAF3620177.1 unnamed protein product [Didymodactylos carnosus]CAF3980377.1 unnamed protein product [Didymodactylos carnosus]